MSLLLRCPRCLDREPEVRLGGALLDDADGDAPRCPAGHVYPRRDGFLTLSSAEQAAAWDAWEAGIARDRAAAGVGRAPLHLPSLPESAAASDPEWAERAADLRWLRRQLARLPERPRTAIDVGSFNGWLCAALRRDGLEVTGLDLFRDEAFGLGAQRQHDERWRGIQLDVCRPELVASQVDLVVLDHGLHFLPDPIDLALAWSRRVAPGGMLAILGLRVFADPRDRRAEVEALRQRAAAQGVELFPLGGPGLLTRGDADRLRASGVRLMPALERPLGQLRARLQPRRPRSYRGLWLANPRARQR
ncbi:MAG: methyltransferase domain-containing protein [Deltaproteobacteria bacterium]|nr:methyltransferase domain-containing protein [Deltaproteobacteria bacterium]